MYIFTFRFECDFDILGNAIEKPQRTVKIFYSQAKSKSTLLNLNILNNSTEESPTVHVLQVVIIYLHIL